MRLALMTLWFGGQSAAGTIVPSDLRLPHGVKEEKLGRGRNKLRVATHKRSATLCGLYESRGL